MKKKETKKDLTDFTGNAITVEESYAVKGGQGLFSIVEDAEGFIVEEDAEGI